MIKQYIRKVETTVITYECWVASSNHIDYVEKDGRLKVAAEASRESRVVEEFRPITEIEEALLRKFTNDC